MRTIYSAIILSAMYAAVLFYHVGLGRSWKAIASQPKLYSFLAHCALQGNLCGILLKRKRKMKLCSELGQTQYYTKSMVTSYSAFYSFLLSAHVDDEHTSSYVHISCPRLLLPSPIFRSLQGTSAFTMATKILRRKTQDILETRMMNTCWTDKTLPAEGCSIT